MNEMMIKLETHDLSDAIGRLAAALADCAAAMRIVMDPGMRNVPAAVPAVPRAPASPVPLSVAPVNAPAPAVPVASALPPAPQAAVPAPPAPAVPTVPTSPAPGYTLEQLARAGADLISADPAKREQLIALLQQFGVQTITLLPPECYGAFATALRGLGAKV